MFSLAGYGRHPGKYEEGRVWAAGTAGNEQKAFLSLVAIDKKLTSKFGNTFVRASNMPIMPSMSPTGTPMSQGFFPASLNRYSPCSLADHAFPGPGNQGFVNGDEIYSIGMAQTCSVYTCKGRRALEKQSAISPYPDYKQDGAGVSSMHSLPLQKYHDESVACQTAASALHLCLTNR